MNQSVHFPMAEASLRQDNNDEKTLMKIIRLFDVADIREYLFLFGQYYKPQIYFKNLLDLLYHLRFSSIRH